jgi:hypothetical protein
MNEAAPDTVTDALTLLRADGYTFDFELIGGRLTTGSESPACSLDSAVVERLYRFEGESDPGDEMIVFGLHDPVSDRRGTLAAGFGPAGDPELAEHLRGLASRF